MRWARAYALVVTCAAFLSSTGDSGYRHEVPVHTAGPQYVGLAAEPRTGLRYTWAATEGPYFGEGEHLLTYTVAVDGGLPYTADSFAAEVQTILRDPRSWAAHGDITLRQVPDGTYADFVIRLAPTTLPLCGTTFFSCGGPPPFGIVINSARWASGDPMWRGDLRSYRTWLVNHEMGHVLNRWHTTCDTPGQLAPFMTPIRDALGCVMSAWPYPSWPRGGDHSYTS